MPLARDDLVTMMESRGKSESSSNGSYIGLFRYGLLSTGEDLEVFAGDSTRSLRRRFALGGAKYCDGSSGVSPLK